MLNYRVLLVDTERSYSRPVQAFCSTVEGAFAWAQANLRTAGEHAYVVVYRLDESEIGEIKRSDCDQGANPLLKLTGEAAGEPAERRSGG